MMNVLYKRPDGSFVATINGLPYHITANDPLFPQAEVAGSGAPLEPVPQAQSIAEKRAGMTLSRRQMIDGLAIAGFITDAEAIAWAISNTLPPTVEALVVSLPQEQQRSARLKLALFTEARRLDPMVPMLAAVAPQPLTDSELDAFFTGFSSI